MIEAVRNVAAAGVVPVISAGNDRDDFGFGSVGSPGTAPDAISVAAVSNTHVFAPALDVVAAGRAGVARSTIAVPAPRADAPGLGDAATRRSSTSDRSSGRTAGRSTAPLRPRRRPERRRPRTLPAGSLTGAVALVARGDVHVRVEGGSARRPPARSG